MKAYSKHLGTLCILISLSVFITVYYPYFLEELRFRTHQDSTDQTPKSTAFGLVIPKIGVNETVAFNIDPFNPSAYQPILHQGLAHAKNTPTPDQPGTVFIFGHSSDNPFSQVRYNTAFLMLHKLEPGDPVTVYFQDQPFTYQVTDTKIVKPTEVEYLTNTSTTQLILQTCSPVGTSINRLLVFATPTNL